MMIDRKYKQNDWHKAVKICIYYFSFLAGSRLCQSFSRCFKSTSKSRFSAFGSIKYILIYSVKLIRSNKSKIKKRAINKSNPINLYVSERKYPLKMLLYAIRNSAAIVGTVMYGIRGGVKSVEKVMYSIHDCAKSTGTPLYSVRDCAEFVGRLLYGICCCAYAIGRPLYSLHYCAESVGRPLYGIRDCAKFVGIPLYSVRDCTDAIGSPLYGIHDCSKIFRHTYI
ncbi:MAG: hypothetical protein LBC98_00385 [Prevotellaceae bacterium]|jgi:hypothetical protein|nr:hypothetical protein [Prevotellaceae bacterium]